VKYANDDRYSENDIVSHDQQALAAVCARQIADIKLKALDCDVIGIDEGQFVSSIIFLLHEHFLTANLKFHCPAFLVGNVNFMLKNNLHALASSQSNFLLTMAVFYETLLF
jgi:thymidine kinase